MNNIKLHFLQRLNGWVQSNKAAWPEIVGRRDWLRTLRQAQNIKGYELASRLGVSAARISMLESDEQEGAVTLKTMRATAQALDCEFVYLLLPKKSLVSNIDTVSKKPRIRLSNARSE